MAEEVIVLDSSDDSNGTTEKNDKDMECPICLQFCIHPCKLPCGHIFCFLCVKGVAYKNRRCALCRRDIPAEYLENPNLVYGVQETTSAITEDGYQWFYEGRNGWWLYDERTSQEIEDAYKNGSKFCTILVAGYVYVVDFESMLQQRQNDPSRKRQVKRDLSTTPKKGVAGLRIDGSTESSSSTLPNYQSDTPNLMPTIAATDAAIQIASNIIDSTLAHAENNDTDDSDSGSTSSTIRRELLNEVEETLNISNTSSI
ncbi:E3 ubiquitin-protein ligase, partial [Pseudolycoriella hygida]